MVPRGFLYLPLAEKWRSTKQQTSFRGSSGKKSNDLPNAFISVWVTTDVRTVARRHNVFSTSLPDISPTLIPSVANCCSPPSTHFTHSSASSAHIIPPSIPLCLHPITLCCSLILPHLLSLDSGVTFSPGHEFYMIVHLCIWKEKKKKNSSHSLFSAQSQRVFWPRPTSPFPSLKFYVKWMFQWDLLTGGSSRVPRICTCRWTNLYSLGSATHLSFFFVLHTSYKHEWWKRKVKIKSEDRLENVSRSSTPEGKDVFIRMFFFRWFTTLTWIKGV